MADGRSPEQLVSSSALDPQAQPLPVPGERGGPQRDGRTRALAVLQDGALVTEDGAQEVAQALAVGVLDRSITVADARAVNEILMGGILPTLALRQRKLGGTQTSRQLQVRVTHTEMLLQVPVDDGPLLGQQVRQIIDGEVA